MGLHADVVNSKLALLKGPKATERDAFATAATFKADMSEKSGPDVESDS